MRKISLHLTKIPGVPDVMSAVPGMAYFAGTGPAGQTCRNCEYLTEIVGRWPGTHCEKYRSMTGRVVWLSGSNKACKYFATGK